MHAGVEGYDFTTRMHVMYANEPEIRLVLPLTDRDVLPICAEQTGYTN